MKRLAPWIAAALVLTVIFGTIYVVAQQVQRNDADWPQIQLAEDEAADLNAGGSPELAAGRTDMAKSLSPFVIIYSKTGRVVNGSGYLNGSVPVVPLGVLTAAKGKDYSRVTWQPAPNVRIASVSVEANNYYVLSGRSLKQVERNESETFKLAFIGGLLSLAVLAGLFKVLQ